MDKLTIYGQVVQGKGKIDSSSTTKLEKYLSTLEEGKEFEMVIQPVKDARSLKLNRTYWMYLTMVGDHLGYTKEEMHDYFKAKFLCEWVVINGEQTLSCKSTAELSTKDFCLYLEEIFRYCAEKADFILPDIRDIKMMRREEG